MTTRLTFQEAMGALRADIAWLGSMAEDAVRSAGQALLSGDRARAEVVISGDDELDSLFLQLEQRAYELIARNAPVAIDLRFLVSSLRVMSDFERTGDGAVSLAKIARLDWEREPVSVRLLTQMAVGAVDLVAEARAAWREQDVERAARLELKDDALDDAYRQLTAHLLVQHGPDASGLVLHALLAGRHLERIADHAVAVGDRVLYLMTGDPASLAAEIS